MRSPPDDLESILVGPPPGAARAAAVLLHGRGRSAAEMLDLAARLDLPDMTFVAIPAPGGTWYPRSFLAPLEHNRPWLDRSVARAAAVVQELGRRGVPRARVAVVGFSQGACLASELVYRYAGRWGALAALTGGLVGPPGSSWSPLSTLATLAGTPVLLATADRDAWVPLDRVRQTAEVFRAMGAEVDVRVRPGDEHAIAPDWIVATRCLLAPLLAS